MKVNEVIYYCLDAIKAISDDSTVNEDHVLFLLSKYRGALMQQYHNIKKLVPESNYQIVCLNLEDANTIRCTNGPGLVSVETLPDLIPIGKPSVLLFNGLDSEIIEFVPFARLKFVGYNKWKKNFIYAAIGPDKHLYLAYTNPQARYLKQLRLKGIFEDFEAAAELSCDEVGTPCDIMEQDFPMEVSLIPDLIARVVRDILGVAWRMKDDKNDAMDALGDIATYVRTNMKKRYNDVVDGEETD